MTDKNQLKGVFSPDVYDEAVEVVKSCLRATMYVKNGRNNYSEVPDTKLRYQAAIAVIEQETGKATSKSELTLSGGNSGQKQLSQADLIDQARKSPEMAARIAAGYIEGLKSIEVGE